MNTKRSTLLKIVEGFILELLLLTYFLHLIAGTMSIHPHYLLIVMAFIGGIIAYFIFVNRAYSILINLAISLLITFPFILIGLPWIVSLLLFAFVSWRFHIHFGLERAGSWNFLALNTVIMTSLYLIAKVYLLKPDVMVANVTQIKLFVLTIFIFIALRYMLIILEGKWQNNSDVKEVTRIFGGILIAGGTVFIFIYYAIESIRNFIIKILGLTFGKLFIVIASLLPAFDEPDEGEGGMPGGVNDGISFAPEKEFTRAASETVNIGVFISVTTVIVLIIGLIILLRKRKWDFHESVGPMYTTRSDGRKKQQVTKEVSYDYSQSTHKVRQAMQQFEQAASTAKVPRFTDETIKEWFNRMKWTDTDRLLALYDKVRYGNQSISDEEATTFMETLEEIKQINFNESV